MTKIRAVGTPEGHRLRGAGAVVDDGNKLRLRESLGHGVSSAFAPSTT